ncbi:hypothetical protein [Sphingomonas carotinifaciens]|uniref:Uncharacterized protein n=1 Tax=Sphingomonas carotinifaciens TaxID=1166323 RepID=A0A6N8LRG3_9SPHN|nr:hypothetical protein [Sphingomonas carotinifaciens]MBB4088188.1 hypothetical protein [Sphingomonas carotinifaciens]MWC42191.1 hypothetical protein [Sphingomonas carotinifaciens]
MTDGSARINAPKLAISGNLLNDLKRFTSNPSMDWEHAHQRSYLRDRERMLAAPAFEPIAVLPQASSRIEKN